jgi:uncharacterized OB-fold protein
VPRDQRRGRAHERAPVAEVDALEAQFLLPDVEDPDAAEFWAGCGRGELLVQTCASCGLRRMPPRPMCPRCRSLKLRWEEMSGRGTIWSFIVPHPPLLPAYRELAPYNVIVVALDEDPTLRMVGNLVERPDGSINEVDPATIRIGDAVRVVFQRVEDVVLPRWIKT